MCSGELQMSACPVLFHKIIKLTKLDCTLMKIYKGRKSKNQVLSNMQIFFFYIDLYTIFFIQLPAVHQKSSFTFLITLNLYIDIWLVAMSNRSPSQLTAQCDLTIVSLKYLSCWAQCIWLLIPTQRPLQCLHFTSRLATEQMILH